MPMNGIDTSSFQASLNLLNISYDFVMVKATQGVDYVNPSCDAQIQEARSQGKKIAVYHYADGNDPIAEANWFVDNCEGYIREAIFMLDWEGAGVEYIDWAVKFWDQVKARIGYNPMIYMSEYVENAYDWSPLVQRDAGLMLAKYSDYEIDNNYDTSHAGIPPETKHWDYYVIWQWTSKGRLNGYAGDLDCDIAYLTPEQWDKYAGIAAPVPTPPVSQPPAQPLPPAPQPTTPQPNSETVPPATDPSSSPVVTPAPSEEQPVSSPQKVDSISALPKPVNTSQNTPQSPTPPVQNLTWWQRVVTVIKEWWHRRHG